MTWPLEGRAESEGLDIFCSTAMINSSGNKPVPDLRLTHGVCKAEDSLAGK
jgi:hypothetical protein